MRRTRILTNITTFRTKAPSSPQTAEKFTDMTHEYNKQRAVVPVFGGSGDRTMNASGRPKALGMRNVREDD